ncbi:FAD binding domain-containing protein, partial [Cardiosporidium cionae]
DYLIVAEGAHSSLRQSLNIEMKGEDCLQALINVCFISPLLGKIAKENAAMLYFIFNSSDVRAWKMNAKVADTFMDVSSMRIFLVGMKLKKKMELSV